MFTSVGAKDVYRVAAENVGIVLARHILAAPLIDIGYLGYIEKLKMLAKYQYYLIYPERSKTHRGLLHFKQWLELQVKPGAA